MKARLLAGNPRTPVTADARRNAKNTPIQAAMIGDCLVA
jgi:hypothetical protein